jgi:hypothetical protein
VVRTVLSCAATLALYLCAPATARAEDPPYLGWSELFPGLAEGFEPSSEDECRSGRSSCVDKVIREMEKAFDPLATSCDHDAVFALAYLRTTEEYRRTIEDASFFDDTPWVNHEDAVFARFYSDAYDAWHSGKTEAVPEAWAVAFEAADDRSVSATGNLFLGINAHVMRDLPHVLANIGIVAPDGSVRKADHNRVNEFLNRVPDDLVPEIARRFDPTIDDGEAPTTLDNMLTFQVLPTWREAAWRNAERLVAATSEEERAAVEAEIEAVAAEQARAIRDATAYLVGFQTSSERDAYCAENHDG